MAKLEKHILPDCMLVWWTKYLTWEDTVEDGDWICDQGWCDLKYDGINKKEARKARYGRKK